MSTCSVRNLLLCFTVGHAPAILRQLDDVTASSRDTVEITCSIDLGDPAASVKWFKDDSAVSESKKCRMTVTGNDVTLRISGAEFSDAGAYRVVATNKLGKASSECNVTVNCKYS